MGSILIVDNSSDFLNVLSWSLQRKGFHCVTAYSRAGVFQHLETAPPAIILMDVDLLEEDGREICNEIKSSGEYKHIPVILCSGKQDLRETYQTFHADDFMEKPFATNAIIEKIEVILGNLKLV